MKPFRFRVYNPKTDKVRRGKIQSESLESARAEIEGCGFEILELEADTGTVFYTAGEKVWRINLGELQQVDYRPTLGERLKDAVSLRTARVAAIVLAILGLPFLVLGWSAPTSGEDTFKDVSIRLEGRVGTLQTGTLRVRFPQVPLQVAYPLSEVAKDGVLEIDLVFAAENVPGYCSVEHLVGDETRTSRSVMLTGEPLTGVFDLSSAL